VDTTGLIFVVVIVAWLGYLVPHHMARRTVAEAETEPTQTIPTEPTITVHQGTPVPDEDFDDDLEVTDRFDLLNLPVATDLTRRAHRHAISRMARQAALARRRSLVALVLLALAALTVYLLGYTSWWTPVAAGVALIAGLILSRWNVIRVNHRLDRLLQAIHFGDDEATVAITAAPAEETSEAELTAQFETPLSLWDPLPIPMATYISQPLAPRTTRTIDLAGPAPTQPVPVVTADERGERPDTSYSAAL
jgi:hypothetical protein